jgi:hypothetical protein
MSDNLTTAASGLPDVMQETIAKRLIYYQDAYKLFTGLIGEKYNYPLGDGVNSISIGQKDVLTYGLLTEATAKDAETFTPTPRDLTPILHGCNTLTSWQGFHGTPVNLIEEYSEAAATSYYRFIDGDSTYGFAHIYAERSASSPDHYIGTDATALNANLILQGSQLLMTAGAKAPYHHVIDPIQWKELMQDSEAKAWLQHRDGAYAATVGINPDRYVGQIYGVNIWRADAMIESSGLHSIMFGEGAMARAYKLVSTPVNPTPAEIHVSMTWEEHETAYRTFFRSCFHADGAVFTGTTDNDFLVDIIS